MFCWPVCDRDIWNVTTRWMVETVWTRCVGEVCIICNLIKRSSFSFEKISSFLQLKWIQRHKNDYVNVS